MVIKIHTPLSDATPADVGAGLNNEMTVNPADLLAALLATGPGTPNALQQAIQALVLAPASSPPAPVIVTGSVAGVGPSFCPAGTYTKFAVAQTLTGAITTLTNTTNRPQLVIFTINNEAIWYAPFASDLLISYRLVINGVLTAFSGLSRLPPHVHNDVDNRHMTGVINHVLPANTSATFALKEFMQEGNGSSVVVPANTLLSYGGFVAYVQHSV